jgi:hypothetical protein
MQLFSHPIILKNDRLMFFLIILHGLTTFEMFVALRELKESAEIPVDSNMHGLYIVITRNEELEVGDVVRVLWAEPPLIACGYLMSRSSSCGNEMPRRDLADMLARKRRIVTSKLPISHLFALDIPFMLHPRHEMEPFLVRAPHLVPPGGWAAFLRDSGVGTHFSAPRSWQFYGKCWHDGDMVTGKTGGLHMSLHGHTRRCQLLVEYGVCGDSLVNTLPHTKQGVLMYVSNMNTESAARSGDVCYESSMSLSFSALLLAYVETLSLVRRAVYEHPTHPYGGVDYESRDWDYTHTPFTSPYPVACLNNKPVRTVNIASFASKKAAIWLDAEKSANPEAWTCAPQLCSKDVHVGMKCAVRMWSLGVTTWVNTHVTGVDENGCVTFDIPIPAQTLGLIGSKVVVVK